MRKILVFLGLMVIFSGCGKVTNSESVTQENSMGNSIESTSAELKSEEASTEAATMAQREIMEKYIADQQYTSCFLYDVTGDNFPEMIEIVPMYFSMDYDVTIYDFSGDQPVPLLYVGANEGESIYVCEDADGNRFLLYHESDYHSYGTDVESYIRADVKEHSITENVLGRGENYYQDIPGREYAYNAVLEFDGVETQSLGNVNEAIEDSVFPSEEVLKNYFEEYLKSVTVIDEFVLPSSDGMDEFVKKMRAEADDYSYAPDYNYADWLKEFESNVQERSILICGKYYHTEAKSIHLSAENLDETFDSDVLNEFPNLLEISFEAGYYEKAVENRIKIKASNWCENVKSIKVDLGMFELEGDFSTFTNIKEAMFTGNFQNTSYLEDIKKLSQVDIVKFYYISAWDKKDFINAFKLVSEMPNVKVVAYSGHCVISEDMTGEDWECIYDMLSGKVLTCVK